MGATNRNGLWGVFLPVAFWEWLASNSTIHKAAGSLVTGHSQKSHQQEQPPGTIPPLTASGMEQWNDLIVPVKSWYGWEP